MSIFMKSIIIYASTHHGNTEKLVQAIAEECGVDTVDATKVPEKDLSGYDAIGFASGIYASKFHQSVLNFASVNLPEDKKIFFICTYGAKESFKSIEKVTAGRNAEIIGKFGCKGHNTFGPFKLIGGTGKGCPTEKDLQDAVEFYRTIENK